VVSSSVFLMYDCRTYKIPNFK